MGGIRGARDGLLDPIESSDGIRSPIVPRALVRRDDCQLAVYIRHCQSPRHCLAFIIPQVWQVVDATGEAVGDA
jgi:hypothetical protein